MDDRVHKVKDNLKELPPPPAAIEEVTTNVMPQIEAADVQALKDESNNSGVALLTPHRRAM